MVVKVYISGISGNKEVKKRQQRVLLILDSKNVEYSVIDIAEPGAEESKDFMQTNCTGKGATISDPDPRHPLPPQIFNEDEYCGDYDMFDMANEIDEMEKFLKFAVSDTKEEIATAEIKLKNGEVTNEEKVEEPKEDEAKENEVPNEQEETPKESNETEESKETGAGDASKLENGEEADDEEKAKSKEGSPVKSKEGSPVKSKEPSPEKEEAGEKSKEPSPEKTEEKSKESSPEKADD